MMQNHFQAKLRRQPTGWLLMLAFLIGAVGNSVGHAQEVKLSQEVLQRVKSATVFVEVSYRPMDIENPKDRDLLWASGSGFVVAREGLIVTNAHVVDSVMEYDARSGSRATEHTAPNNRLVFILHSVRVCLNSGTKDLQTYDAQVVCTRDMPTDLALLRIVPKEPITSLRLLEEEEFDKLRVTRPVWAVGFPLGRSVQKYLSEEPRLPLNSNGPSIDVHPAAITALDRNDKDEVTAVRHSSLLEGGNSGGPLIDVQGRVVGVNYYGISKLSFAIPVTVLAKEFETTLTYRRDIDEGGVRVKPIIVRVESTNGNATDALHKAMQKIRDENKKHYAMRDKIPLADALGATLEFAEGDFSFEPKTWLGSSSMPGLLVRGAGRNKTRLFIKSKEGSQGFLCSKVEVCNMQIDADVTIDFQSKCRFHDVDVMGEDQDPKRFQRYVWNYVGSEVDFVNCRLGNFVFYDRNQTHIERTSLHIRSWWSKGNHANGVTASIRGCDLRFSPQNTFVVRQKSDFEFRGCRLYNTHFYNKSDHSATIKVESSQLTLRSCRFDAPRSKGKYVSRMVGFDISSGSTFHAVGCVFDYENPINIHGKGTNATFNANSILTGGWRSALTLADSANVVFRGNHFRQFSGVGRPMLVIMSGSNWEQVRPKDGIWIKGTGTGTKILYSKNRFEAADARPAIIVSGGATIENDGGNEFLGKTLPVKIKP